MNGRGERILGTILHLFRGEAQDGLGVPPPAHFAFPEKFLHCLKAPVKVVLGKHSLRLEPLDGFGATSYPSPRFGAAGAREF